jgi:enterochelin esterase-like enzyme
MSKRQALAKIFPGYSILILSLIFTFLISGCQPAPISQTPAQPTATTGSSNLKPSLSPTVIKRVNASPEVTATPDCLIVGGVVQDMKFHSDQIQSDFSYKIYLPPCYDVNLDQNYPVLYLLHGLFYDNQQWVRLGLIDNMDALIQSGEIPPFIVVLPLEAKFDPPNLSPFADTLVDDLLDHVDNNFRTLADNSNRAIGGLSRGAAWSLRIGFEHHDLFSKVGLHSLPIFQTDSSRLLSWLTQIPKEDLPLFFIDIGRGDPERLTAQAFANQLDLNGIHHEWYLFNNGHVESYWSDHLELYLRWYAEDW